MIPKTSAERLMDGEITFADVPNSKIFDEKYGYGVCKFPHCDSRILHLPEECESCAAAVELQEERVFLNISNTLVKNRKWKCPADRVRTPQSLNWWPGNTRKH